MKNTVKKYLWYLAIAVAVIFGFGMMHLLFTGVIEPSSPYMIVDKSCESDVCPLGYEPVELTGIPPEQGERVMITCKIPISYQSYVHYPEGWQNNLLNPKTWQGQATKIGLFVFLGMAVCLLVWRIWTIVKKKRKAKI